MLNSRRVTAGVLLLAVTFISGIPSTAHADHVADLFGPGYSRCRLGGEASGIGVDLITDVQNRVTKDGLTIRYVCRFTNVPEHVSEEESMLFEEWFRPSKAVVRTVGCWRPEFEGREDGIGRLVITPNGVAVLRCDFSSV